VGDGWLGQAERLGQVTDAGFTTVVRGDHRHQPKPHRIGEGLEDPGQVSRLADSEWLAQQGRAAQCRRWRFFPVLDAGG